MRSDIFLLSSNWRNPGTFDPSERSCSGRSVDSFQRSVASDLQFASCLYHLRDCDASSRGYERLRHRPSCGEDSATEIAVTGKSSYAIGGTVGQRLNGHGRLGPPRSDQAAAVAQEQILYVMGSVVRV